ncbi:MAG: thiamine phosphate synthase, partial [Armatimonadetes bacterium]|nr:thiamine phosphate synthase [Armatimonadota bacterium]
PVVGIGGITAANAAEVIRAGAAGVAVIAAVFGAEDVRGAAAALRQVVDAALGERGR